MVSSFKVVVLSEPAASAGESKDLRLFLGA
jgi:hypothetical protein